jgi:hypothetical protein
MGRFKGGTLNNQQSRQETLSAGIGEFGWPVKDRCSLFGLEEPCRKGGTRNEH